MSSTVEKLSSTRAKLTIEIPFSDLTPAIHKAYRDLASQVSIPGFRKGHVPDKLIDARLGRGVVISEAVNAMLPDIYAGALEEHKLTPLGRPEIEMTKMEEGETVEFTAEVDIVPDFDMPDFSSVSVTVDALEDLDTAVDDRIEILRERFAQVTDVDRPSQEGDQVRINLVGAQNGEVLPDANAEGLTYVIGSDQMLEGLDEAVTGCVPGDEKTFQSTLAGGDHAGEPADITVTVTEVQERTLPEVDDDFAQMVSQFDTVAEMRDDLKKAVAQMGVYDQLSQARDRVMDEVVREANFDIPQDLVDEEVRTRVAQITDQLKSGGVSLAEYVERIEDPEITSVEDFENSVRKSVEKGVRAEILLSRVADDEKVGVDQKDLTNFIFQKARENGTTPEQEIQHMQSHDHLAEWMSQIRQSKALDSIVVKATITDTDGKPVDVASLLAPSAPVDDIIVDED